QTTARTPQTGKAACATDGGVHRPEMSSANCQQSVHDHVPGRDAVFGFEVAGDVEPLLQIARLDDAPGLYQPLEIFESAQRHLCVGQLVDEQDRLRSLSVICAKRQ